MLLRWGSEDENVMESKTHTEIKAMGFRALVAAWGEVQAEKLIVPIQCEPFDYTQWQRTRWPDKSVEERRYSRELTVSLSPVHISNYCECQHS